MHLIGRSLSYSSVLGDAELGADDELVSAEPRDGLAHQLLVLVSVTSVGLGSLKKIFSLGIRTSVCRNTEAYLVYPSSVDQVDAQSKSLLKSSQGLFFVGIFVDALVRHRHSLT